MSKTIEFSFEGITNKNSKQLSCFKEACTSNMKQITARVSRGKLIPLSFLKSFKQGPSQLNLRFSMAFAQVLRTGGHPGI